MAQPEWWFYHLERSGPEAAAGPLLAKCLERGWRVLVVSPRYERLTALDTALWTRDAASFLAHARIDDAAHDPARQPILLAPHPDNRNGADVLVLLDGAEAEPGARYARCMVLFDGHDEAVRASARAQYKAARGAGLVTRYFQQDARGNWAEQGG